MKTYTSKDLENEAMKQEFRNRNTHIVDGYFLFMYRVRYSKNGRIYNKVSVNYGELIPLYFHESILDETKDELRIQTTSWGALNYEEMKKKMSLYQTALDTVEWFNNFDWETADILSDYE